MVKINGKTNPFQVKFCSDRPFASDEYYQIMDKANGNPVCKIVETSADVSDKAEDIQYEAIAKIENSITKPINPTSSVKKASFKALKPFILKCEPKDGFLLGQVPGTEETEIPSQYTDLVPMYNKDTLEYFTQEGIPLVFPYVRMCESPHIGLFGGSGSGKTYALKVFIEELMKKNIPAMVLDPHLEMNFSGVLAGLPKKFQNSFAGKFKIFTIGENIGINFCDLSTSELINIMSFSGELSGPMTALLATLHRSGESFISLSDKIDTLITAMDKKDSREELTREEQNLYSSYASKIPSTTVLSALNWRLSSLNNSGIFKSNADAIIDAILHRKIGVVRGSLENLNVFASYAIEKLYLKRRAYVDGKELNLEPEFFPPFFICTDEAHLFCPKQEVSLCRKILKTIAQEGRKYGVFEIFATQRPALLDATITAQLATKFIFRLGKKEDIDTVSRETDLTAEEIKRLPFMTTGENYVSSAVFGKTIYNKFRVITTEAKNAKSPFEELSCDEETAIQKYLKNHLPICSLNIADIVTSASRDLNAKFSISDITAILEDLATRGQVLKDRTSMGINWTTL